MRKIFGMFIILLSLLLFKGNVYAYQEYKIGDIINYLGYDYYVIEDSDSDVNYVTLLKKEPLTTKEINKFSGENYQNNGVAFSYDCDSISVGNSSCGNISYDNSEVNRIINNWSEVFQDDLVSINGYKARIITTDELVNNLGYEYENILVVTAFVERWIKTVDTPEWVYNFAHSVWPDTYWTMNENGDENDYFFAVGNTEDLHSIYAYNCSLIRPVINLSKEVLENCPREYTVETEVKYNSFEIGDIVSYNGEKYGVIEKSDENKDYLVLLKYSLLTSEEISKYSNGRYNSMHIPYYKNTNCNSKDNVSGCTTDYSKSIVKEIVDNWSNDFKDDLISVNGYKARLLTMDDMLENLNVYREWRSSQMYNTQTWVYYVSDSYWTMSPNDDSGVSVYSLGARNVYGDHLLDDIYPVDIFVEDNSGIRPVININKCVVDDGCYEESYTVIGDRCNQNSTINEDNYEKNNKVASDNNINIKSIFVAVGNTLSSISNILLIICGILIIGGLGFLGYSYIKSKKELKND